MKNLKLLLFSFLFLNSACKEPNFINLHSEVNENEIVEFNWLLKVDKRESNYIQFEIIQTKELNNGLYDLLNAFEEKVDYKYFIDTKEGKTLCRLKTNSVEDFEIGNYYIAQVYRNQKEVFFSKDNLHKTLDYVNQEKTINSKLSALTTTGWAFEKNINITYKIILTEAEIIDYLMEDKNFESLILSRLGDEFRSLVGRSKKEDIVIEILQRELKEKLKTDLKGIIITDLKLID